MTDQSLRLKFGCSEALYAREAAHRLANMLQRAIAAVHLARRQGPSCLDDVVAQLSAFAEVEKLLGHSHFSTDLARTLDILCDAILRSAGKSPGVSITVTADQVVMEAEAARSLLMIVAELVTNSLRHAFAKRGGAILVKVCNDGSSTEAVVEDDGVCDGWSRQGGEGHDIVDALARRVGGKVARSVTPLGSARIAVSVPRALADEGQR